MCEMPLAIELSRTPPQRTLKSPSATIASTASTQLPTSIFFASNRLRKW
jgi:hypothetical protein